MSVKSVPKFIVTPNSVTCVYEGKPYVMEMANKNAPLVIRALRSKNVEKAVSYFDIHTAVKNFTKGAVEIKNGSLYYEGRELVNSLTERILFYMREGLNEKPLIKFLKKLMSNPNPQVLENLFKFLEHEYLPITDDGDFLAYKGVNNDYTDRHTGKFSNKIGQIHKIERVKADPNPSVGCSCGFHVGSHRYATEFAGLDGKVVICKVNPANVVCVPHDSSCEKVRCCEYEVVDDYNGALKRPKYSVQRNKTTGLPTIKYHNKRDSSGKFVKS
jgi:hypothetical protein